MKKTAAALLLALGLTFSPTASYAQETATLEAPASLSVPPLTIDSCPDSHPIKGYKAGRQANRSADPIYHVPGGRYYAATDPEECFATAADAEAAGYRASSR